MNINTIKCILTVDQAQLCLLKNVICIYVENKQIPTPMMVNNNIRYNLLKLKLSTSLISK